MTVAIPRLRAAGRNDYWHLAPALAMAMVAVVCLRLHENIPGVAILRPVAVATYGGLGLVLLHSTGKALNSALAEPAFRLVLAYWIFAFGTAPLALWPGLALSTAKIGITVTIVVLVILLCRPDARSVQWCTRSFLWFAGALAVLSFVFGTSSLDGGVERLSAGGSLDSNDLAAVMAMAIPFGLAAMARERKLFRMIAVLATVLAVIAVIKTGSRGGAVAAVAGGLVYALAIPGRRKFVAVAGVAVGLAAAWSFAPSGFRDRITSMASLEEDYNYTAYSGRKQIWKRARGYIKEHPVIGVGAGNFPIAEGDFAATLGRSAKWSTTHNTYLQVFSELGAIGGGIFVSMLLLAMQRGWRLSRVRAGGAARPEFLASVVAFALSGYFLSHAYFYPLFGLLAINALATRAYLAGGVEPLSAPATTPSGWRTTRSLAVFPVTHAGR